MATKPCPSCGKPVSSAADKCPHCGHPMNARSQAVILLAAVAVGVLIFFWVGNRGPFHTTAGPVALEDIGSVDLPATNTLLIYFGGPNWHDPKADRGQLMMWSRLANRRARALGFRGRLLITNTAGKPVVECSPVCNEV